MIVGIVGNPLEPIHRPGSVAPGFEMNAMTEMCTCTACGNRHPRGHGDDAERAAQIAARVETFTRECERMGVQVEGNRVDPRTAAQLVGMKEKTFNGWRNKDQGPEAERIPVRGATFSYDLNVLAAWVVDQKFKKI